MTRPRLLGGALVLGLLIVGATTASGTADVDRVVVADGGVEVTATLSGADVAAGNASEGVVELRVTSDDGTATASAGTFAVHDPQGRVTTVRGAAVDGTRQRLRTEYTSGSPAGTYTVDILSLPLDVVTPEGVTRHLELQQAGATSFVVRPESHLVLDVAPESVPRGQKVYVHGLLEVAGPTRIGSWLRSVPGAGATVSFWFDPAGSRPRTYRGTATVGTDGYFGREFTADASGTWSVEYTGTGSRAPARATSPVTARATTVPVKAAIATTRANGTPVRARVILPRTVTVGLTPKKVVADVGFLFAHQSGNSTWVEACHQTWRLCSENPVVGRGQIWDDSTARTELWFDANHPAGVYRVALNSQGYRKLAENEYAVAAFSAAKTITTIRVVHTSALGVTSSRSRPVKGATVTLSGRLREARAEAGIAGYYGVTGAKVAVYFDPDGPRKARYVKTVRTGKKGAYSATVQVKGSGAWIVKNAGTTKRAPARDSVRVRVR